MTRIHLLLNNVVLGVLLAAGLGSCTDSEQKAALERKQRVEQQTVDPNEYTLVTPISGVHCKACSYSACGIRCVGCDNGLEYYCLHDFSGKNETK